MNATKRNRGGRNPGHYLSAEQQRYRDEGCEHCTLRDCKYNGAVTKNCPYRPKHYNVEEKEKE